MFYEKQNEPAIVLVISHKILHSFCAECTKIEKEWGLYLTKVHKGGTLGEYGIFEKVLLTEVEALGTRG